MSTYHLHARLFEGSLCAPTRNELRSAESEDYPGAVKLAEELAGRGFRVWLYEHRHGIETAAAGSPYRVIAEWTEYGERIR